jgi:membrane protease YdiL (CAAX protease family)
VKGDGPTPRGEDEREPSRERPGVDHELDDGLDVPSTSLDRLDDEAPSSPFDAGHAPWSIAAVATLLVGLATWVGFDPATQGSPSLLVILAAVYLMLGAVSVLRLRARGELSLLRPRSGDLSIGALVAFLLYGMAFAFHALVTSPGHPGEGWIVRVYLMLGDPFSDARHLVAISVAAIGALEELTWRGLIFPALESRLGTLRSALLSIALFAAAHLPTLHRLADPVAGLNPLLVIAALGCGAGWTYLRWRVDRLVPVMLSHALFTWAIVEFPLWIP